MRHENKKQPSLFDITDLETVITPTVKHTHHREYERVKNMTLCDGLVRDDFGLPIIKRTDYEPKAVIAFSEATNRDKKYNRNQYVVHTFLEDVSFERLWNSPYRYVDILSEFGAFCSPGFSLYTDMDYPYLMFNTYRNRMLGAFYQKLGVTVIPTIVWGSKDTYEYCFGGLEKGGIVAVSGCPANRQLQYMWLDGFNAMLNILEPTSVLIYGNKPNFVLNVKVFHFTNPYIERMRNGRMG